MSGKKSKNRDRYVPSPEAVRRQIEKGNVREALKEAKLCFRSEASDANRAMLEEAFLARIEQLHKSGQPNDAKAVLADLAAFGAKSEHALESMTRLRVLLGEGGPGSNAALDANPALAIEIADGAVLDQNAIVPNFSDLPQHVKAVREALAAVETGDDNAAIGQLNVISRGSPLADWKLFVRGLSAFYARDDERAEANWSRLEKTRPAARIARILKLATKMAGSAQDSTNVPIVDGAQRLAIKSENGAINRLLTQLSVEWKRQCWNPFFATYRQMHLKFGSSHENVFRQIVDIVWKSAVRNGDEGMLNRLEQTGPAPELDPFWNRSRAMLAEHSNVDCDLNDIESLWCAYVADLRQLAFISEAERDVAAGLVYQRLGDRFGLEAALIENDDYYAADEDDVRGLHSKAKQFYRCGIQACNQLEDSYLQLIKLHERYEEIESAAEVMMGLSKVRPDRFEAARWMASYYLSKDAPGQAAAYVRTAQRLRPRDPRIAPLMWNQKLTMARGLVLNRQFEAARQEISDAAGLTPADNDPCALELFRAGIELKAGNPERAQSHIEAALSLVEEPAFAWMQMSSLAAVFQLARGIRKKFDDRLAEEITKPVSSATAGRIARFLARMRMTQTAYVGRAAHERLFIKYLKRTGRNPWQAEDLKSVCEFLRYFPAEKRYRSELIEVGLATCSGIPQFAYWAATEMLNHRCTAQAERRMEELLSSAISMHQAGSVKLTESELETSMETLSLVKDRIERRQQYGGFGMFSGSDAFIADFDDDNIFPDDDGELQDDEEDDELGSQMPLKIMNLIGMNTDSSTDDFDISDDMLKTIERQMPPDIRSQLGQIATMMGLPLKEAMRRMLVKMAKEQQASKEHRSQHGRSSGRSGK